MLNRFHVTGLVFTGLAAIISQFSGPVEYIPPQGARPTEQKDIATQKAEEYERVKQMACLSMTVWGEARGESLLGQHAVASVIANRIDDPRFPNTACGVVHQPKQFSMWNAGDPNGPAALTAFNYKTSPSEDILEAIHVSMKALSGDRNLPRTSVNYHSAAVKPIWRKGLDHYEQVGAHIFYVYK